MNWKSLKWHQHLSVKMEVFMAMSKSASIVFPRKWQNLLYISQYPVNKQHTYLHRTRKHLQNILQYLIYTTQRKHTCQQNIERFHLQKCRESLGYGYAICGGKLEVVRGVASVTCPPKYHTTSRTASTLQISKSLFRPPQKCQHVSSAPQTFAQVAKSFFWSRLSHWISFLRSLKWFRFWFSRVFVS